MSGGVADSCAARWLFMTWLRARSTSPFDLGVIANRLVPPGVGAPERNSADEQSVLDVLAPACGSNGDPGASPPAPVDMVSASASNKYFKGASTID